MPQWHVSLNQELFPACWLSSAFCSKVFLISVPVASLCYCSDSVVCPSLHILRLFKKFPQLLIYLNSFPPTLSSCRWRLGISWKMESVFYAMGTEYSENKRKTKYFQPSELFTNLRLIRQSSEGMAGKLSWCFRY